MVEAQAQRLNKSGQVLGQKGINTRARILEVIEELLVHSRGVPPSLAALARASGISSPTFYLYFADVGEAIFEVVQNASTRLSAVLALLEEPWPADETFPRAEAFVRAYFNYWMENAPALRARNRIADQGDPRFVTLRVETTNRIVVALAAKIVDPPVQGGLPTRPDTMAGALITAMERLATVLVLELYPSSSLEVSDSIRALANLVGMVCRRDSDGAGS